MHNGSTTRFTRNLGAFIAIVLASGCAAAGGVPTVQEPSRTPATHEAPVDYAAEQAELTRHAAKSAAQRRAAAEAEAQRVAEDRAAAERASEAKDKSPDERAALERAAAEAEAERIAAEQAAAAANERIAAEQAAAAAEAERIAEERAAAERAAVQDISEVTMWATANVNIRSGPGTNHSKIGLLRAGTQVTVNGKLNDFYRTNDGRFISGHYLTSTKPEPKPEPQVGAKERAPVSDGIKWKTWVANSGGQSAIDARAGGLTNYTPLSSNRPYYAIHQRHGGQPILGLQIGDLISIDGRVYRVVTSSYLNYNNVSDADKALAMEGAILIQTCNGGGGAVRVIGANPA